MSKYVGTDTLTATLKIVKEEINALNAAQNTADIYYIAYKSGIDLSSSTSDKINKITSFYTNNFWNDAKMKEMVVANVITADQYKTITGKTYA